MKKSIKKKKNIPNKDKIIEAVLEQLGPYCSKCGAKREKEDIKILGGEGSNYIVHVGCSECNNQDVFHFVLNVGYKSAGGLVTDIQQKEAKKFLRSSAVSKEDILDIHLVVKEAETADELVEKLSVKRSSKSVKAFNRVSPKGPSFTAAK